MRKRTLLLLAALAVGLVSCSSGPDAVLVEPAAAATLLADDIVTIDVRTPDEVASGTIGDALAIDWNSADFAETVAVLDRSQAYLVYCRSGNRSRGAVEKMLDLGFEEVYELEGGIVAWVQAGGAITG